MSAPNIITTGHDANGLSTFIDGPEFKAFSPHVGLIYSTDGQPLDLNEDADIAAFAARDHASLVPKEGATVIVVEWPPGTDSRNRIHRTLSVDIGIMIQGSSKSSLTFCKCYYLACTKPLLSRIFSRMSSR